MIDVTGDGKADMVIRRNGRLIVYPHNGQSASNPWTTSYDTNTTGWDIARVIFLADATGTGKADLVMVRNDQTLHVYPHNGLSGNAAGWNSPYSTGLTGWDIADWIGMGDLTGDGKPDLVSRRRDGSMWTYPHNGKSGTAANWTGPFSVGVNWNSTTALLVGDVTGDGRADLVARDGSGNLTVHVTATGAQIAAGSGWGLANVMLLQDVTGDGRLDITVRDSSGAAGVYPHSGATTSNPWSSGRYAAGGGWQEATLMAL
ncbi:FG-GAP repeat domain-containing protein [Kribbella sp. NPDC056951]|uniref:FG-GAP repeat domain-containing protein n=1 Tax=Kribbella sp. NPDC056951 TaxID=3345978 RepID=UPI00363632BA